MPVSNVAEINLPRAQIEEIVGKDQRKVRVFETLINSAIIFSGILAEDPDGNAIPPVFVTRWANGRMEQYPVSPTAASGATVVFPVEFSASPNITHSMYRSAGTADDRFTITALSQTGLTWVAATSAVHMWRAVGTWKE